MFLKKKKITQDFKIGRFYLKNLDFYFPWKNKKRKNRKRHYLTVMASLPLNEQLPGDERQFPLQRR